MSHTLDNSGYISIAVCCISFFPVLLSHSMPYPPYFFYYSEIQKAELWTTRMHVHPHRYIMKLYIYTSSTAQGGGGSFKNRKPIGEVGCCESGMAERIHWWTERCLRSPTLALSFSDYLPTYLSIFYVSIDLSLSLSLSSNYLSIYPSIYLSICGV